MKLYSDMVDLISSKCGMDVSRLIGLYPANLLKSISDVIDQIPVESRLQYVRARCTFTPYVYNMYDYVILVLNSTTCCYVQEGCIVLDNGTIQLKYGTPLYVLCRYKNPANMLFAAVVDCCKDVPQMSGLIRMHVDILWDFVGCLQQHYDVGGILSMETSVTEVLYEAPESPKDVYTFVSPMGKSLGELRIRGNKILVFSTNGTRYFLSSYRLSNVNDRYERITMISTLALMHGIVLGINDCTVFGSVGSWKEQCYIPCKGSYLFER